MFGFEFLENFNYPYISKSITDFWRRWHMSISEMQGLFQSINTEKKGVNIFGSEVHKLAGEDTQSVTMDDITLQLSPQSFFQLNIPQAKELYHMAVSKIDP